MGLRDRFKKESVTDHIEPEPDAGSGAHLAESPDTEPAAGSGAHLADGPDLVSAAEEPAPDEPTTDALDEAAPTPPMAPTVSEPTRDIETEVPTFSTDTQPESTSESPDEPTASVNTLLAGIQSRLQMVVRRPVDVSHGELSWDVGGALAAQVVLDHPNSLPLTADELESWGLTPTAAAEAAIRNLIATDPGLDQISPDQRAWVVTEPEDHPAVWLCSPDQLLRRLGLTEAVLLAPVPTELVVVDPTDEAALERILRSTKAIVTTEPGLLWPAPLRVTMDRIEPWVPSNSHPCATIAAEMHALAQLL